MHLFTWGHAENTLWGKLQSEIETPNVSLSSVQNNFSRCHADAAYGFNFNLIWHRRCRQV